MVTRHLIPLFLVVCLVVPVSASGEVFTNGDFTSPLGPEWSIGSTDGSATITIQRLTDNSLRFSADGTGGNWGNKKITQKVDLTTVTQLTVRYKATTAVGSYPRFRVYIDGSSEKEVVFYGADGTWYTTTVDVPPTSQKKDVNVDMYVSVPTNGGLVMFVDYITGTHSRTSPVINSISRSPSSGQYPLDIGYSADITNGNPSNTGYDWTFYKQSGTSWIPTGQTSTSATPTFTASDPGTYRASLYAFNDYYTTGVSHSPTTTVTGYVPEVDFIATTPTSIAPGGSVTFQANMSGATSYLWEFGDGTSTSSVQHPTKQYNDAGTYTVKLTGTNEWGSADKTRTNYINVGSHSISFDKIEYVSYETATITHTLFNPDFDSHTYEGRFYKRTDSGDLPASPLQTWSITGATGPKEISMSGLARGDYAAVLFVDGFQETYATAAINKKSGLYGNVILASAPDTKLADATVTLTGGSDISDGIGAYGIPLLAPESTQSVSVTKTSYVHEDHEITLSATPTSYNYNMYMLPSTYDSGVIRGIVRDADTYQPYAGANVTLGGTSSDTTTTNTHGYFEFTGLGAGTYTIDAETTDGYSSEQITGLTNKATLYPKISGLFTITVEVLDTGANPIGSVDVSISQSGSVVGSGSTASTGKVAIGGVPAGTITILLTKTNYVETSESHVVTGSETITMEMLKVSESPGMGVQYPPQTLTVVVKDASGSRLPGATVTATGIDSVTPIDWILQLLGISEQSEIMETIQSGTTDGNGQITFMVFPGIQYRIDATMAGYTFISKTVHPSGQYIEMTAQGSTATPAFDSTVNISVYGTELAGDNGRVTVQYQDTLSQTNQVNITITDRDTDEIIYAGVRTEQTFMQNATVTDRGGRELQVTLDIDHATHGSVTRDYSLTFRGVLVDIGLPDGLYVWFSLIMIIIIAAVFTQATAAIGALTVSFTTAIFWVFGWLDALGPEVLIAIPVMFVIAIMGMIMDARKKEGYR